MTTHKTCSAEVSETTDLKNSRSPATNTLSCNYDAFGNRTAKLEDGQLKAAYRYAPGISGPVAKVDSSGQDEARFIYATRSHVPDYLVQGSNTYRLITDQLGSVRFVVNASTGSVAQEITYDPFGEVIADTNPGFQPFGYAGGLYEPEAGLTHFGAREYDAELGRWTSSDPIGFSGGDTNLYGYVVQDPVNLIDASGLIPLPPSPPTLIPDIDWPDIDWPDIDWPDIDWPDIGFPDTDGGWPFPIPCPPVKAQWEPVLFAVAPAGFRNPEIPINCSSNCNDDEGGDAPDPEKPEDGVDGPIVPPPTPSPGWDPKPVPPPRICIIPGPRPIPVPC